MSLKRFHFLTRFIAFDDKVSGKESRKFKKFAWIRDFLETINETNASMRSSSPYLAIDEILNPYLSYLDINQYNPNKPAKSGFCVTAYVMLLCLTRNVHPHMPENHRKQTMKHPHIIFQGRIYKVLCKWCKSLQFHRWIQHIYGLVFHIGNYSSMGIRKENSHSWYNGIVKVYQKNQKFRKQRKKGLFSMSLAIMKKFLFCRTLIRRSLANRMYLS